MIIELLSLLATAARERRAVAAHEASHATVAAVVLGTDAVIETSVGYVEIDGAQLAGHCRLLMSDEDEDDRMRAAIVTLAGAAGERRVAGEYRPERAQGDLRRAYALVGRDERRLASAFDVAERLVGDLWPGIERVTDELLSRRRLDKHDLVAAIGKRKT